MATKMSPLLYTPEQTQAKMLKALAIKPMTGTELWNHIFKNDPATEPKQSHNYSQVSRIMMRLQRDGLIARSDPNNNKSPLVLVDKSARPTPPTSDLPAAPSKRKYRKKNGGSAATNGAPTTPSTSVAAYIVRSIKSQLAELERVLG